MAESPPHTASGSEPLVDLIKNEVYPMFVDLYNKLGPTASKGAYADLAARLTAMDALIAAAGSGTAMLKTGTDAERLAYGSPADGMVWCTTDTNRMYTYEAGGTSWNEAALLTATQTLSGKTLTSPVLNTGVSGTAIKDEDDMASNSATHLSYQKNIKAYVDAEIADAHDPIRVSVMGPMQVQNDVLRIPAGVALTLTRVRLVMGTAPSGGSFSIKLKKNGSSDIFPAAASNILSVGAGATTANTTTLENNTLTATDYIRLDITAANSAEDMMLILEY